MAPMPSEPVSRRHLLVALPLAGLVRPAAAQTAAERWDFAAPYGARNLHTEAAKSFAADVGRATAGRLELAVQAGAELFKAPEIKNAVTSGQVPIGDFPLQAHAEEDAVFGADSVPFLAPGWVGARRLYELQRPLLEKRLAASGLRLLYSLPSPGIGLVVAQPPARLADVAGWSIRAGSRALAQTLRGLGAEPVSLPIGEVAQAFRTGRIRGAFASMNTAVDQRSWQYAGGFLDLGAHHPRNATVVQERAFRRLPADIQTAMVEAAKRAETAGWSAAAAGALSARQRLAANGVRVIDPAPADLAAATLAAQSAITAWQTRAGADGDTIRRGLA